MANELSKETLESLLATAEKARDAGDAERVSESEYAAAFNGHRQQFNPSTCIALVGLAMDGLKWRNAVADAET